MTEPTSHCPDCGTALQADSPQALCPTCLMKQALASRTMVDGAWHAPAVPPISPEELAEKFPGFEILECLGRGGMGVVYKARQKSLGRLVAIKILPPERVGEARFADRFAIEAATLAKLSHPNIVTVHDFGVSDSQPSTPDSQPLYYIVMEFVDGVNLRDLLREGKLEPKQALAIVPPICEALQYAHDKGIVHRDIKPENLLLDKDGRVKIADFGIASLMGAAGEIAGTPPYMAPEQKGANIDHRADIYALGVVLYEMLTGQRPDKDLIAPSRKVHIDVRLDEMVLRALEKEPERRYQTAAEFRTMVETMGTSPVTHGFPAQLLKSGESLYATPEFIATMWGAMKLHQGMGSLMLYQDRLEFQAGLNRTVIPLSSIRRLELISYPLLQSPAGLRSIEVEFEDGGNTRRLLFTPSRGMFSFVGTTNRLVFEWFGAIREAVAAHVGNLPQGSSLPVPYRGFSRDGRFVSAFAMLLAFTGLVGFLAAVVMTGSWRNVLPLAIPFIFGITFVIAIAWRQRLQWKKEHPLPGGMELQPKPDHSWRWLAVIVIAAAVIPLVAKWVVTPATRGVVTPAGSLLRVTVRVLDVPEDFEDARLLRPGGLMDSGEVKVLAAPCVELTSGGEGRIQFPDVPLLAHGGSYLLSGRAKTLYVKPELQPGTAHVRYTLEGDVRGTEMNKDAFSRQAIRSDSLQLGEWQLMESHSENGRRQLAVISIEMAGAETSKRAKAEAERATQIFRPVVERELRLDDKVIFLGLDFESGDLLARTQTEPGAGSDGKDRKWYRCPREWVESKGVDMVIGGSGDDFGIAGLESHFELQDIPAGAWENANEEDLAKALARFRMWNDEGWVALQIPIDAASPLTYAMRTGDQLGMLQLTGRLTDPDGVRLRYKLVADGGSARKAGQNLDLKPQQPENTGPAGDQTRQTMEAINAINDTNRFLDLELAVIDAKASGLGDMHPTVSLAAGVLARFKETHPNVPDAVWRQLVAQRLDKAKEGLLLLTKNGLGHAHPTVVAQQARVRALEDLIGTLETPEVPLVEAHKPVTAPADGSNIITLSAQGEVGIAGKPCPPDQLDARLKELAGKHFETVVIRPDAGTLLKRVLELTEACKTAGLEVGLVNSPGLAHGDADLNNLTVPEAPLNHRDRIILEDLALHMIVAIREKDDAKLKSMAADRIKGWPESLPVFAVELREHYRQIMGDEKFEMKAGESLVDGDLGAVRCTGPAALEGKCIVMLFVKTDAGWKNQLLRAATENIALTELLADFRKQMEKSMPTEKPPGN